MGPAATVREANGAQVGSWIWELNALIEYDIIIMYNYWYLACINWSLSLYLIISNMIVLNRSIFQPGRRLKSFRTVSQRFKGASANLPAWTDCPVTPIFGVQRSANLKPNQMDCSTTSCPQVVFVRGYSCPSSARETKTHHQK